MPGVALALIALLTALLSAPSGAEPSDVMIEGRKLLVNGVPLFLKGVNWNPIAVGRTHPEDLDYLRYVVQDGDLMREAGINAVRTYECICDLEVLDALYERGIFVLNTIFANAAEPLSDVAPKVNAVKDHPAVLMWVVGNEWNYNGCYENLTHSECLDYIEKAARIAKSLDSKHPVASIYGRLPQPETLEKLAVIDVWGINYYNGLHFEAELKDVYWKTELNGTGSLFKEWAKLSDLPMFIGEYGADAWDTRYDRVDYDSQALAVQTLTEELNNNTSLDGGVAIGGFIFELADEWWKDWTGTPYTQESTGFDWGGGPYPDFRFNEEWWGLVDVERRRRKAYYAYKDIPRPVWRPSHAAAAAAAMPPASALTPAATALPPRRLAPMTVQV